MTEDGDRQIGTAEPPPEPPPEQLLGELAQLRRRARSARHGYWFPLVLFGLLIAASAPLYVQQFDRLSSAATTSPLGLLALGGFQGGYVAIYWLFGLTGGYWVSAYWYRRHARRVGLATPARAFLITGIAFTAASILAFAVPLIGFALLPGDLILRGTFPFLIIAAGLWVLVRAERSWALGAIAAVFTATALLSSLYNTENILFRLGWTPGPNQWDLTVLPNIVLPAVVLLIAGLAALAVQRRPTQPGTAQPGTAQPGTAQPGMTQRPEGQS